MQGYSDHLFDLQVLATQAGHWAGYYSRSKKPKPLKTILDSMIKTKEKSDKNSKGAVARPEVDVDAFLAQERAFKEKLEGR